MWNYKIAMATFRTSQYQDGDKVLKCHGRRCQGTKRRFRKPEQTKEHINKDSNGYFVEKLWTLANVRESAGVLDRYDSG